jgi:hypothetical protein
MVQPWNDPLPGVVDVLGWDEFEEVVENVARDGAAEGQGAAYGVTDRDGSGSAPA